MQWSCPHCGVALAVPHDTLGTGWSFSQCYRCGGYALVRKTEINIIKVDKAPPGEKVILPEASEDPSNRLMSQEATQKFVKHTASGKTRSDKVSAPAQAQRSTPTVPSVPA